MVRKGGTEDTVRKKFSAKAGLKLATIGQRGHFLFTNFTVL